METITIEEDDLDEGSTIWMKVWKDVDEGFEGLAFGKGGTIWMKVLRG